MHRILPISVIVTVLFLTLGCAKQGMPSGGPKDVTPPRPLSTHPDNRTLNFADKSFYIEFDEYVVIKDAENNIMVSPPMQTKPEYKTRGKGIQVKINDTLQSNTTYLFQFKEAIADYNEGNMLPSFEYVFSTGTYIDSMTIKGSVVDAFTMEPSKEAVSVWLMCPRDGEEFAATWGDSAAKAPTIAYATRCNKDGSFSFNHITPGEYNIFAIQDEDKNMQLGASESMGFYAGTVNASIMNDSTENDSTTDKQIENSSVRLLIFTPRNDKQRITSSDFTMAGKARITTLLPLQAPHIECDEPLTWRTNATRDTMTLWTYREKCDSLHIVVNDPSGIQDTLKLRWRPKKGKPYAANTSQTTEDKTGMKLKKTDLAYFDTLSLTFKNPLDTTKCRLDSVARIMLIKDSSVTYCGAVIDSSTMSAYLTHKFRQGEKYLVKVLQNRFHDIYGHTNDSSDATINVSKPEDYGNLRLTLQCKLDVTAETKLIIELLDEKKAAVATRHTTATENQDVVFQHLTPAKYGVRVTVDSDGNGKWDTGDFAHARQPERVYYMDKSLDIRANWDFEETMTLEEENK